MALSDVEAIVYAKSDDVVSDVVKELVKRLDAEYRGFMGKIILGIILLVAGIALAVFASTIINLQLLYYAGIGVAVFGVAVAALAFRVNIKVESANLKLYPILFAGFEHGEFFAIDPYGNGDDVELPVYNLEDITRSENILVDLQKIVEEAFRGEIPTVLEKADIDGSTIIVPKPLKLLYTTLREFIDNTKGIRVEHIKYNMIMPEENEVPYELKIPLEKSGFTEDMAMKKISLESVEKLFEELVGTNRNWEEIVDRLKDLKEKYEPLHGQIVSHFQWLKDTGITTVSSIVKKIPSLYTIICPRCLLSRNYFNDPSYPAMSPIIVEEEGESKVYYQCGDCGYRLGVDNYGMPHNPLKTSFIDEYFNQYWLGVYNGNREYIDKLITETTESKKSLVEGLRDRLRKATDELAVLIDEFTSRVDKKLMDVKLYTDILEKIGLTGAGEIYKAVYENAEFMKKTLRESPDLIADSLTDLLKIRIDPSLFNQTYLEKRRIAADMMGLEDIATLITTERSSLEYDKLTRLYSPLYKPVETRQAEEEREPGESGGEDNGFRG